MKKILFSFAVMLTGTALLTGCLSDDNDDNKTMTYVTTDGVLVINNGNVYNGINGSLTYVDFNSNAAQQNVFQIANGASLGGTPNDVMVRGERIYIAGSDENAVFVLNKSNFKLIKKISTLEAMGEAEGVTPRHLASYGDKVFVSTYGGYVGVIDTLTLTVSTKYKVGSAPEGLAIGGTSTSDVSLYVANSDYGNGNGSISKIDLTTGSVTEIKNENIRNPQEIAMAGNVAYVLDWGYYDENWKQLEAGVYCINGNTVTKVVPNATGMAASGQSIVTYNAPYGGSETTYSIYDIAYHSLSTFRPTGGTPISSPCAISIDPNSGLVYIASRVIDPDTGYPSYTLPGFMNIYDGTGQNVSTTSFATGVEPHAITFTYGTKTVNY